MSQFNGAAPVVAPQQSAIPQSGMQPTATPAGASPATVQPPVPQDQPAVRINQESSVAQTGQLDLSGLDQLIAPGMADTVINDLNSQAEQLAEYHFRRFQSQADQSFAQREQGYQSRIQALESALEAQLLRNASPEQAVQLRTQLQQARLDREAQELRQQYEPIRQQQLKFDRANQYAQASGGVVSAQELMAARNPEEMARIYERKLAQAQYAPQIPASQMSAAPPTAGSGAQPYDLSTEQGRRAFTLARRAQLRADAWRR